MWAYFLIDQQIDNFTPLQPQTLRSEHTYWSILVGNCLMRRNATHTTTIEDDLSSAVYVEPLLAQPTRSRSGRGRIQTYWLDNNFSFGLSPTTHSGRVDVSAHKLHWFLLPPSASTIGAQVALFGQTIPDSWGLSAEELRNIALHNILRYRLIVLSVPLVSETYFLQRFRRDTSAWRGTSIFTINHCS